MIDFPHFRTIRFINTPGEGVAKSQMHTEELVINLHWWRRLKKEHKIYVLLHEEGHMLFDTRDEFEADAHASRRYLEAGYDVNESVKALSDHLDRNNPVHAARAFAQYERVKKWEKEKKERAMYNYNDAQYTNFLGIAIGKKARARKAAKIETRLDRRDAKTENLLSKAQSRMLLAQQGIETEGDFSKALKGLAPTLGAAAGIVASLAAPGSMDLIRPAHDGLQPTVPAHMGGDTAEVPGMGNVTQQVKNYASTPGINGNAPAVERAPTQSTGAEAYATGAGGGTMPPTKAKEKEKEKEKYFLIGGAVLALLLIVMLMKKK